VHLPEPPASNQSDADGDADKDEIDILNIFSEMLAEKPTDSDVELRESDDDIDIKTCVCGCSLPYMRPHTYKY